MNMHKKLADLFENLGHEGRRLKDDEQGFYLSFMAVAFIIFFMFLAGTINVGHLVGEKIKVQYAADEAVYSEAVWAARVYNYLAYTNRTIMSYLATVAFVTALESHYKAWYKWETNLNTAASGMTVGAVFTLGALTPAVVALKKIALVFGRIGKFYEKIFDTLEKFKLRDAAYLSAQATLLYQTAVTIEAAVKFGKGDIAKSIGKEIDPKIKINEAGKDAISSNNTIAFMKVFGFSPHLQTAMEGITDKLTSKIQKKFENKTGIGNSLKKYGMLGLASLSLADKVPLDQTLFESADGFAAGGVHRGKFPRVIIFQIPFTSFKIAIGGKMDLSDDGILKQRDFTIEMKTGVGFLDKIMMVILDGILNPVTVVADYTPPGSKEPFNVNKWTYFNYCDVSDFTNEKGACFYSSAYKDVRMPATLFGIKNQKVTAISRAETFYFDYDLERSIELTKPQYRNVSGSLVSDIIQAFLGNPREPNLFNPFWHARLKRIDLSGENEEDDLSSVGGWLGYLDGNFGLQNMVRNSIQNKILKDIETELVNEASGGNVSKDIFSFQH